MKYAQLDELRELNAREIPTPEECRFRSVLERRGTAFDMATPQSQDRDTWLMFFLKVSAKEHMTNQSGLKTIRATLFTDRNVLNTFLRLGGVAAIERNTHRLTDKEALAVASYAGELAMGSSLDRNQGERPSRFAGMSREERGYRSILDAMLNNYHVVQVLVRKDEGMARYQDRGEAYLSTSGRHSRVRALDESSSFSR